MSVYPDSDKVSGPEGIFLRSTAVGYWHGEGTAGPREPEESDWEPSPPPPMLECVAGEPEPYQYVVGRERWLLVLDGAATLRRPDGESTLDAGDLVCLAEGPAGAHQLLNGARVLMLSTTGLPAAVCYPDSGRWLLRSGFEDVMLRQ